MINNINDLSEDKVSTLNLKLLNVQRKEFKETAHKNGTTMQSILSAFIDSYIDDPNKFKIKLSIQDAK